jgi:hypothetical protein
MRRCPDIRLWLGAPPGWRGGKPVPQVPRASIRHLCLQHSPDGFNWGYGGSGPAELALNIAALIFPAGCDGSVSERLFRGRCSLIAWKVHQALKAQFLIDIPPSGGTLLGKDVDAWVAIWLDLCEEEGHFTSPDYQRPAPPR